MNVCPQCGSAIEIETTLTASKIVECERCGWSGSSKETVYVDDLSAGIKTTQTQLEIVYQRLAREVAPTVGRILIETGMVIAPDAKDVEEDKRRVQFLAKVLEGSTKGTIAGIAKTVKEEMGQWQGQTKDQETLS